MTIRPAHPADAPAIAHIHVATWQATYKRIVPESYLSSLSEADFTIRWTEWLRGDASVTTLVAEDAGSAFGFASGGPIRKPLAPYDAELYAIYVLPDAQRTGAGRGLVQSVAQHLRNHGQTHMLVWVLRDNPATTFYQHLGATLVTGVETETVEIGGTLLPELAFGWPLDTLALKQAETSPS